MLQLITLDHGDGRNQTHKQVTFDSNNTPSVPTTTPVLFTADPGGAPLNYPQLFFILERRLKEKINII